MKHLFQTRAILAVAIALLPGVPRAESRRVGRALELLQQRRAGSLIAALELARFRVRGRDPGANGSAAHRVALPDRLLVGAAKIASARPTKASRALLAAQRLAQARGIDLDRQAVDQIRDAAELLATQDQRFSHRDPALRGLIPDPKRFDLAEVRRYAHDYARYQQEYNSPPRELERELRCYRKPRVEGKVSYWDVDPQTPGLSTVGLVEASPFRTAEGKVRIYCHYLDKKRFDWLSRSDVLGKPTDTIDAKMTSAARTLLLFPKTGLPFMLKFSGEWDKRRKKLTRDEVRSSVERSLHQRTNRALVPEPAGLLFEGPDLEHNVIYRPLPLPRQGGLQPGDVLLPAHVLMSRRFGRTKLGRKIFARHGGSAEAWFRDALAPQIADLVLDSLERSFTHLELHGQNIDLLIGADGTLRRVFVKDLLDVAHDPAAQAARGRLPVGTKVLRGLKWGNLGEEGANFDTSGVYAAYLHKVWPPYTEGLNPAAIERYSEPFHGAIRDHLVAAFRRRIDPGTLRQYAETAAVFEQNGGWLFTVIGKLRDLLIKSRIQAEFREDPTARQPLVEGTGKLHASTRLEAERVDLDADQTLKIGFVGSVPVAVKQASDGRIDAFFFRFE
jgi:hypothetical protein